MRFQRFTAQTCLALLMIFTLPWRNCSPLLQDASINSNSNLTILFIFLDRVMEENTLQPLEKRFWEKLRIIMELSLDWREWPLEMDSHTLVTSCLKSVSTHTTSASWIIKKDQQSNKLSWTVHSRKDVETGEICTTLLTKPWTWLSKWLEVLTSMTSQNTENTLT